MKSIINIFLGILLGTGLIISSLNNPLVIQNALNIFGDWNLSLFLILAVASVTMWITVYLSEKIVIEEYKTLLTNEDKSLNIKQLIVGSIFFGLGWGTIGLCPAPTIINLSYGTWEIILFLSFLIIGLASSKIFKKWSYYQED
jgi:uncharacterized membrane protein YedE/YeeE